jgi:hypothetical protein
MSSLEQTAGINPALPSADIEKLMVDGLHHSLYVALPAGTHGQESERTSNI